MTKTSYTGEQVRGSCGPDAKEKIKEDKMNCRKEHHFRRSHTDLPDLRPDSIVSLVDTFCRITMIAEIKKLYCTHIGMKQMILPYPSIHVQPSSSIWKDGKMGSSKSSSGPSAVRQLNAKQPRPLHFRVPVKSVHNIRSVRIIVVFVPDTIYKNV